MKETKDRVEDSLHATRAAIEQGIVPGGGSALLHASNAIKGDTQGAKVVKEVCTTPFIKILSNAGFEFDEIATIMESVIEAGPWNSYHVHDRTLVNMKEAGILDPFKVTRNALENAASVAGTLMLTEAVVAEDVSDETSNPGMGMPGGMDPNMLLG
jgi:chaperonin GroEL